MRPILTLTIWKCEEKKFVHQVNSRIIFLIGNYVRYQSFN